MIRIPHFLALFALLTLSVGVSAQRFYGPPALQAVAENHACGENGLTGLAVDAFNYVGPPAGFDPFAPREASIVITYDSGIPANVMTAFDYAADIWASLLNSSIIIRVTVHWESMEGGALAFAGPNTVHANFTGATESNTYFPAALANSLTGSDLNSSSNDLTCTFNSDANWYYGTNGQTPGGQYDLVTAALHELGHGLGMIGSSQYNDGFGFIGFGGQPYIYDTFVETGAGNSIESFVNGSVALGDALTGNSLYWNGPEGSAGVGGGMPRLYAPGTYQPASSYSHLNESTYPFGSSNALMTPIINSAESNHNPGPAVLGMFEDMGWTTGECVISSVTNGMQSPCNPATNMYSQQIIIAFAAAPTTGLLSVNGSLYALGASPHQITMTGLPADGLPVDLEIYFTNESSCIANIEAAFTAPESCCEFIRYESINPLTGEVAIRNAGGCTASTAGYTIEDASGVFALETVDVSPGSPVVLTPANWAPTWSANAAVGELLLRNAAGDVVDYLEWGFPGQPLSFPAMDAGIWDYSEALQGAPPFLYTGTTSYGVELWDATYVPCAFLGLTAVDIGSCEPEGDVYDVTLEVQYEGEISFFGQVLFDGLNDFAMAPSPMTVTLENLPANGEDMDFALTMSFEELCTASYSALFTAPASCICPSDLNQSGLVEVADLLLILADFGCLADCSADINGDGSVTVQDVLAMLSDFGTSCGD